ncbi:glutamate racemase [Halomonas sp. DP8Y7-1]|uniref:glutamate racemase n=1 Tax=Halomonas sp. DP8Y7-1 TaxID=2859078 RepID=UPI001C94E87D|nr:glutamate racemase [Halomonas sp. DP8Y7-1]MBY6029470.1 glutamate racemase [Halomonas sp. DP8Y7-1]
MAGPVLVFDSGVGGLSVVRSLRQHLPETAMAYCCDNAMMPYGIRPDDWLVQRIVTVCAAAVDATSADTLVVACNTASTLALNELRERLALPVVGTVPAIKPAALASRSGCLALLATSATVSRPYTQRLIDSYAPHCRVKKVAADALVTQAEHQLAGRAVDLEVVRHALAPLIDDPLVDTVVLGCTHFPLLLPWLDEVMPRAITWIDSGDAIARRTVQVMQQPDARQGAQCAWLTASSPALEPGLSRFGFDAVRQLPTV